MTSQTEHKRNTENVRRYYQRHRELVLVRKILRRAKSIGAIPSLKSVEDHAVPITALACNFAAWCENAGSGDKLDKQLKKMRKLRNTLEMKKIQIVGGDDRSDINREGSSVLADLPANEIVGGDSGEQ